MLISALSAARSDAFAQRRPSLLFAGSYHVTMICSVDLQPVYDESSRPSRPRPPAPFEIYTWFVSLQVQQMQRLTETLEALQIRRNTRYASTRMSTRAAFLLSGGI